MQTTEDTVDEGTGETFTVSISGPAGGGGPAPSLDSSNTTVTTTITDDDAAPTGITLSASPNSLGEDDAATGTTITATMNGSTLPTDTLVTIGTLSGTATSGTDYTATTLGNITINGSLSTGTGSFTVTPTDDSIVEGDETIVVPGTTTVTGLTVTSATITLTDDNKTTSTPTDDKDSAELSISGPASNVAEGSDATFEVTLSAGVAKEVTVAWTATGNTDDYAPASGTVTFAANSAAGSTQDIDIAVTDDDLSEGEESFTVTLGTIGGDLSSQVSLKSGSSSATATIAESDPITVNVTGDTSVDEGDDATYTVSLSGGTPTADLTVSYATADGTATAGSDYTGIATTTLTFTSADHADKEVDVETIDDMRAEAEEDFTFTISNPLGGGATPTLGTASVTTTIGASDPTSPPVYDNLPGAGGDVDVWITVSPDSVNEGDGGKDFTVTATHDAGTAQTGEVEIALTLGGTADSSDYTAPASASVTIPANTMSGAMTLTLTMIDDDLSEGDETIFVGGHLAGSDVASGLITITDNDSPYLSITGPDSNVAEGDNASFTVALSKTVAADVTVAWSVISSGDTAVAADLPATSASGSVTFDASSAAGVTQTFTIPVTDDNLSEGEETFTVTLGEDTGDKADEVWVRSTAASATATIAASDPITVSISGPSTVDEGAETSDYTVSLSGGTPTADLTVNYATADGGGSNDDAKGGEDYIAKSATLTFTSADHADKTFTVQTTDDMLAENSEDFTVSISSPSGGGHPTPSLDTSSSVTTTIRDNDALLKSPYLPHGLDVDIRLSVTPTSVNEGAGSTDFTVTATHDGDPHNEDVTIQLALAAASTATAGSTGDYTVDTALASLTIPANAASDSGTLTLIINDDDIVEGDETIIVGGNSGDLVIQSAVITINDDEATYLSITGPDSNVAEGDSATFTVTPVQGCLQCSDGSVERRPGNG